MLKSDDVNTFVKRRRDKGTIAEFVGCQNKMYKDDNFLFNDYGTAVFIYVYINKSGNHHILSTPALRFRILVVSKLARFFYSVNVY